MKVYFTASIRGKRLYGENYKKIFEAIQELGYQNVDDLLFRIELGKFYEGSQKDRVNLYRETISKIRNADIVILEVSIPSLSMGYVMEKSLVEGKPVIALYLEGLNSYFAEGIEDERLQVLPYRQDDIKKTLKYATEEARKQIDARFTILFPPRIMVYLDKVCKEKGVPRSVFIRNLIEERMRKRKEK